MARRAYGSGALLIVKDGQGRETFYGKWRQGDRQVKRRIGRKRAAGSKDGLTKAMAERELRRRRMGSERSCHLEHLLPLLEIPWLRPLLFPAYGTEAVSDPAHQLFELLAVAAFVRCLVGIGDVPAVCDPGALVI